MPESVNGGRRYQVHCSGVIAATLRRLQRRASRSWGSQAVASAFARVIQRLEIDPNSIGEPLYRLAGLRMLVRTCVVRPLVVDFGVCEDRPLVFIKGVKLLPERET
jgi:hypothetical protein